jgi:class 3 adenylate cyclase/tetratricopeptide (TPR) repeat protein
VTICPSCGHENQAGAKFCSECGNVLAATEDVSREERKIVTVLFADLVGFTSRAERMDPEDVRSLLSPYYARLRSELERHGGTVEKFIGDAVVALFGAPVAHEDDPERAVRAALAIRDWVREEDQLQVRIAVNTGEALVTLGARPVEGEGMAAGDVVNTAARLQAAAPVNGILVGETTYRATRDAIDFAEADSVEAKGKHDPVRSWEALQARARFGVDVPHEARTALVGRERELDVLRDALARVRAERSPQLVTLVSVPGMGKSRLLYELSRIVDAEPELISWRQGRSLPYGEGVSFWALAEMVKAQAGILETDTADESEAKLERMGAEIGRDSADADWVRRHLRALIGLGGADGSLGGDDRAETFAAWRRFFEALAEERPLVLVFEDLHWADEGLLDFVDHLVDWAAGVAILVVCSARPELLERRPGWGGGKPNAITLSLSPLAAKETARLLGSLLGSAVVEAGEQAELLARAGGNPLYAEQYVQMLAERRGGEELPLPESIQGIVSARLDALAVDEKRLLQDAAVIGKVFWPGAVAGLGGAPDRFLLEERLHALERKQFIRRERRSSVAGETQHAFLHVLLRDVAYGQIPRGGRIEKHVLAAGWIESLGRPDDHAETLAHHYLSALELARAANQDTAELAPRARAALREAGDRARSLNAFSAAVRFYREALELWEQEAEAERADLLFRISAALFGSGEEGREEALEQARAALLSVGDPARAAETDALLGEVWWLKGNRDRAFEHLERAYDLARGVAPSPGKARVLSQLARFRMLASEFDTEAGGEALELAEALQLDDIRAHALITVGMTRCVSGDAGGRGDVQRGLDIALAGNWLDPAIRGYSCLASIDAVEGALREALRLNLEAEEVAVRLGGAARRRWVRGNLISLWLELGEWEQCARAVDEFLAEGEVLGSHYMDVGVLGARAWLRLARGEVEAALEDQAVALASARLAKDPQSLYPALALSSCLLAHTGRIEESGLLFDELMAAGTEAFKHDISEVMWAADLLDRQEEALRALPTSIETPWFWAARAVLGQEFGPAAAIFDSMGAARSAAYARFRAAETLVEGGRRAEADEQLQQALAFFRSVDATRYVREGEALLAASA